MAKKKVTPEQVEAAERQLKELQRQVEYDTKDYTLELLLDKFEKGDFYIPDYQRQFVWKPNNRSLFIESVLLGLPIPFMFFAGCDDGRLEIIDGAQQNLQNWTDLFLKTCPPQHKESSLIELLE